MSDKLSIMQIFLKKMTGTIIFGQDYQKQDFWQEGLFMEHLQTKSHIYILKRTGWIILLVVLILAGGSRAQGTFDSSNPGLYAWWGTIYPEFCFEKVENNGENKPVKISFWLAKALDW